MKRYPLPDLLKGFAVFLIVPVHIMETFIDYPGREGLLGKVLLALGGPVGVPVFMMVMGYFIANSKKKPWQNVIRGIKVFVLGLLLNIGLNANLLIKIRYAGWQINPWEYIWGVDIFYLAGLSIVVLAFLKGLEKGRTLFAFILAFLVLVFTAPMNTFLMVTERSYILPFIAGTYSWAYFPLFPWLAYPLFGFAFFYWEDDIVRFYSSHKLIRLAILAVAGVLVVMFGQWGIRTTINLPDYYHHTFWFAMWGMTVIVLWVAFLRFLVQKYPSTIIGNFLQWLGKNITQFYVIQWLIIGNIATAIYQTQAIHTYVYWYAGIFAVTILLTWLLEKANIKLAR